MNGMSFVNEIRRLVGVIPLHEIALTTHKSESTVAKAIAIDKRLSQEVKDLAGDLSLDILYEISQLPEANRLGFLQTVHAQQLSRRQVRNLAAQEKVSLHGRKKRDRSTQKIIRVTGATITVTCAGLASPAEIKAALEAAAAKVVAA